MSEERQRERERERGRERGRSRRATACPRRVSDLSTSQSARKKSALSPQAAPPHSPDALATALQADALLVAEPSLTPATRPLVLVVDMAELPAPAVALPVQTKRERACSSHSRALKGSLG